MKSFLVLLSLLLFNDLKPQAVFRWQWQLLNDTIQITGQLNAKQPTVICISKTTLKKDFAFLYRTIDELAYNQWADYRKAVNRLSKTTVRPFEKSLRACKRIVVEMDSSLLNFPVEFLQLQNEALALFRPTVFTINGFTKTNGADTLTLHKGFILRDPTSDPEDACTATFNRYPSSTFRSTLRAKPSDFRFKPGVDFVLISAHGFTDSLALCGAVFAKEEAVRPALFQNANLKLVYIDGCQQGINWAYIKALAQSDKTSFYLGPIVSNDSGESSTKTINWFFSNLGQTNDPVLALWQTRKQLHGYYKYKQKRSGTDVINKSLVFRIYKL